MAARQNLTVGSRNAIRKKTTIDHFEALADEEALPSFKRTDRVVSDRLPLRSIKSCQDE